MEPKVYAAVLSDVVSQGGAIQAHETRGAFLYSAMQLST